jgi:hypothetical protein
MRRWWLGVLAVIAVSGVAVALIVSGSDDSQSGGTASDERPSEQAARRAVPFGFFGTVVNLPTLVAQPVLEQQFELMARSGVESARIQVPWAALEPARGAYDWTASDLVVGSAARARIQVLANVLTTPAWASKRPDAANPAIWPPRDPASAAAFMRQLIRRYGPRGTFWEQNPDVPKVPVRWWQIFNEPMGRVHWAERPWAPSFTRLLRATYTAAHEEDPGANVVAASLATFNEYTWWDGARDLYRAGARPYFDVISVHPFTSGSVGVEQSIDRIVETLRRVRRVMRSNGDGRKPVIITELSWPAALGKVPKDRLLGLETTGRGQAQRLRAAYDRLARERRKWNIPQVYWFNWASEYDANSEAADVPFRFSGLTRFADNAFTPQPILRTYADVAARYEGCRKDEVATGCA